MSSTPLLLYFRRLTLLLLLIAGLLLSSCSPVKQLQPGEYLLNKNTVRSDKPELNEQISSIIKQKPNRKILGLFRFHLGVYSIANTGKETRFKRWMKSAIGEEPIVLDTIKTHRTVTQLAQFMKNEGYFNAVVSDSIIYGIHKKAQVIYQIRSGEPYRVGSISYSINDPVVNQLVLSDADERKIVQGQNFRTADFQEERDRITMMLRNTGYYEFNQSYISFEVDTNLRSQLANINISIAGTNEPSVSGDSCCAGLHKIYRVKNVFVQTDYDPLSKDAPDNKKTIIYKDYQFYTTFTKPNIKYDALIPRIFIEKDALFKVENGDKSYQSLSQLSALRSVNIRHETTMDSLQGHWLNSYILLSPAVKQDYKFEIVGTNNGGNFGLGGNFTWRNKNIFRGAESMEFGIRTKMERIPELVEDVERPLFNNFEIGPELTLRIPRMVWPLRKLNLRGRSSNPVSVFKIQYSYQDRPEYFRSLLVFSGGFEFQEKKFIRHFVYPAEINYSNFNKTPEFDDAIINIGGIRLKNYYNDVLTTGGRYTFSYNTQQAGIIKNFVFLRATVEMAGNSIRLFNYLTHDKDSRTATYEVFEIPYSQFILPELDLRYYQAFDEHNMLVYRFNAGVGFAYMNSDVMPYEKSFFAGGANDLRAYKVRTVGPGSFSTTEKIERIGDIKINFNLEMRSDIFRFLEGAAFIDAGNVWLRKTDNTQPGGRFLWENSIKELAVGAGLGLRLDFRFFIFRIDGGIPIRDPSFASGERWIISDYKIRDTNFNFGIGYPF